MDRDVPDRAVLFDFFGTLVTYEPDRARIGSPRTPSRARSWGLSSSHDEFVATWDAVSRDLEARSRRTRREFDMTDVGRAFAASTESSWTSAQCEEIGRSYVEEWQQHIRPIDGVSETMRRLSARWAVGVVSNTHDVSMVPRMLAAMGIDDVVSTVVLSVVHGRRKPHRSIYRHALEVAGVEAARTVFVGDDHEADFVGPESVGICAYLIDPDGRFEIPTDRRLHTVLDIENALIGR